MTNNDVDNDVDNTDVDNIRSMVDNGIDNEW